MRHESRVKRYEMKINLVGVDHEKVIRSDSLETLSELCALRVGSKKIRTKEIIDTETGETLEYIVVTPTTKIQATDTEAAFNPQTFHTPDHGAEEQHLMGYLTPGKDKEVKVTSTEDKLAAATNVEGEVKPPVSTPSVTPLKDASSFLKSLFNPFRKK